MKIDIHVHTKKSKCGDADTRSISNERFKEIIEATDVKILAVTNHNEFDFEQYKTFSKSCNKFCQIWPGIELDVVNENRRGHLIIISNPRNKSRFNKVVKDLLENSNSDDFKINISDVAKKFDKLDVIYIAHYYTKRPNLTDEDLDILLNSISNKNRLIKEATNSISAGIYISHGHKSIYGSDIHDWNTYIEESKKLPDLRLEVESFEQFCLLLEKNDSTINTTLDQKNHEEISITPFTKKEKIKVKIYNDINIFFGSKGTGKTEILKALSKHYNSKGFKTEVFSSSTDTLNEAFDIKGKKLNFIPEEYGLDSCKSEIANIRNAEEIELTSISAFINYYETQLTNTRAKRIAIKDYMLEDVYSIDQKFENVNKFNKKLSLFNTDLKNYDGINEILGEDLFKKLSEAIDEATVKVEDEHLNAFVHSKSIHLFNQLVEAYKSEISKKTGAPSKPSKTGFSEYANNRIKLELDLNKIVKNINTSIQLPNEYVGSLGVKGDLYCQTLIKIQDGSITDGSYSSFNKISKTLQKEFSKKIVEIKNEIYSVSLFEKIAEFRDIEGVEKIDDLVDLAVYQKSFVLNNNQYIPSSGETSMLLLHRELNEDRDIYILDEPERSLGNDYISDVIVPILKEHAKIGKRVIIATHDANIAVRTLPYNTIYRRHDIDNYKTFSGNPFTNYLVCETEKLEWREICMRTLEGGRDAFGERGRIYGN